MTPFPEPSAPTSAPAPSVTREGKMFRVMYGGRLPDYCVKCGAPSTRRVEKTFFWHNPWLYLLILLGVLWYFIIALIVRKKMTMDVPLCDQHFAARRKMFWIGAALLLTFLPAGIMVGKSGPSFEGPGLLVGILMLLAGMILMGRGVRLLSATNIEGACGTFKGASAEFLNRLQAGTP